MLKVDKLETMLIGLRVEILSGLSGILFEAFLGSGECRLRLRCLAGTVAELPFQ